jgi:hypothetical protein
MPNISIRNTAQVAQVTQVAQVMPRNANAVMQNMGQEILNPPPPLVRKLMELQAELRQHFPNNPNVIVAFNGHGGCLIGMEQQAMNNLINNTVAPALQAPAPIPRRLGYAGRAMLLPR